MVTRRCIALAAFAVSLSASVAVSSPPPSGAPNGTPEGHNGITVYCGKPPKNYHGSRPLNRVELKGTFIHAFRMKNYSGFVEGDKFLADFEMYLLRCVKRDDKWRWNSYLPGAQDLAFITSWRGFGNGKLFTSRFDQSGVPTANFEISLKELMGESRYSKYERGEAVSIELNIEFGISPESQAVFLSGDMKTYKPGTGFYRPYAADYKVKYRFVKGRPVTAELL